MEQGSNSDIFARFGPLFSLELLSRKIHVLEIIPYLLVPTTYESISKTNFCCKIDILLVLPYKIEENILPLKEGNKQNFVPVSRFIYEKNSYFKSYLQKCPLSFAVCPLSLTGHRMITSRTFSIFVNLLL